VLVEFDCAKDGNRVPKEIQYQALVDSGLPIAAILDSGDKSLHGWIRIDAADKAEYDRRRTTVYDHFGQYDFFDSGNKAPSKYSRCPGAERNLYDANGKPLGTARQELLAVKIGAVSFEDWVKAHAQRQAFSEEEQNRLRSEALEFYRPRIDLCRCQWPKPPTTALRERSPILSQRQASRVGKVC